MKNEALTCVSHMLTHTDQKKKRNKSESSNKNIVLGDKKPFTHTASGNVVHAFVHVACVYFK